MTNRTRATRLPPECRAWLHIRAGAAMRRPLDGEERRTGARDVPSRAALVCAGSAARGARAGPASTERAGTNAGTSRFGAAGGGTRRFIGVPTNDLAVHVVHEERGLCHNSLLFWIIYQRIAANSVEMIYS